MVNGLPKHDLSPDQSLRVSKHLQFLKYHTSPVGTNGLSRITYAVGIYKDANGINLPISTDARAMAQIKSSISAEGILFISQLEGCSKNLLLFLIQYKMNKKTLHFPLNALVRKEFNEFCNIGGLRIYKKGSIDQSIKVLGHKNAMVNVGKREYMVNPLIIYCARIIRQELFKNYTAALLVKRKDPISDFYPRYQ